MQKAKPQEAPQVNFSSLKDLTMLDMMTSKENLKNPSSMVHQSSREDQNFQPHTESKQKLRLSSNFSNEKLVHHQRTKQ